MSAMNSLGMKRKEVDGASGCCPCELTSDPQKKTDWENEVVYPKIEAYGALARLLPIGDMKPGVQYTATVTLRLSGVDGYGRKDGPTRVSIECCAISDLEADGDADGDPVLKAMRRKT